MDRKEGSLGRWKLFPGATASSNQLCHHQAEVEVVEQPGRPLINCGWQCVSENAMHKI